MQGFSFDNIIVLVDGVEIVDWADGDDVIAVKRRVDSASDKVGAGGSMAVSVSSDKSGEFMFKLQATSRSNAYLQSKVDAMELLGGDFTPSAVRFQDLARNDLAAGSLGYVKSYAPMNRGEHVTEQEWGIVVENLIQVYGANLPVDL
jgi:hypothetical protein